MFRGCTVVDPPSVLTTHLTELVKQNDAELLSYAETQKLLDELPREQQKLVARSDPVADLGRRRAARAAGAAGRAGLDPRPVDHPGRHPGGLRRPAPRDHRDRRACADAAGAADQRRHTGPAGYIPIVTLSPEWEAAFAEALTGPPEDRQLAMAPSKLTEFMQRFRSAFDTAAHGGEAPVLLTSGGIRFHVRAIVERIRPATPVLAQTEISPRARIRTVGSI